MIRAIFMATLMVGLLSVSTPVIAADTYAEASAIAAKVKSNTDYHGLLAKKLAYAAMDEISQHDTAAAKIFVGLARGEAAKAGGSK